MILSYSGWCVLLRAGHQRCSPRPITPGSCSVGFRPQYSPRGKCYRESTVPIPHAAVTFHLPGVDPPRLGNPIIPKRRSTKSRLSRPAATHRQVFNKRPLLLKPRLVPLRKGVQRVGFVIVPQVRRLAGTNSARYLVSVDCRDFLKPQTTGVQ